MARENIIFGLVDDAILSMWAKMAYLSSFPDGRWCKFATMVVNCPICGNSRVNMRAGRRLAHCGGLYYHGSATDTAVAGTLAKWDADGNQEHLVARWLQKAGYWTSCIGKDLNKHPWEKGDAYHPPGWIDYRGVWLEDSERGGAHASHTGPLHLSYVMDYNGTTTSHGTNDAWTTTGADASGRVSATDYDTDRINLNTAKALDNAIEPFYLQVGFHAVKIDGATGPAARHAALSYVPERAGSFAEVDISDKPAWLRAYKPTNLTASQQTDFDTRQISKWRQAQAVDEWLRDTITKLKAQGRFDRTVIILTTENANHEGEHRLDQKGVPYEPTVITPLYIRHPSIPVANMTSAALIQTFDVAPTLIEIARARTVSRAMDGMSFLPLLDGRMTASQWRQAALMEWLNNPSISTAIPSWTAVRTATRKYIEWAADGSGGHPAETEMYLLDTDPDELTNVANNPAYAAEKASLAVQLAVLKRA